MSLGSFFRYGQNPLSNFWRLLRYGPGLYRATRKLGGGRLEALRTVVRP